jgi:hypothetical protein
MTDDYTAFYLLRTPSVTTIADFEAVRLGNFESKEAAIEWVSSRYKITDDTRIVRLVACAHSVLKLVK